LTVSAIKKNVSDPDAIPLILAMKDELEVLKRHGILNFTPVILETNGFYL
jgi:hypothetical protein